MVLISQLWNCSYWWYFVLGVNKRQYKYAQNTQLWRTKDVAADETLHTMGAHLCCGDYLTANAPAMWGRNPAKKKKQQQQKKKRHNTQQQFWMAAVACFIYLLIHQCWSSLGLQCWLLQRYLQPETGTLKWSLVYPYRQLMKRWMRKMWRSLSKCDPPPRSAERHRVGCYQSNLAPLSTGPCCCGSAVHFAATLASSYKRLKQDAQKHHIPNARSSPAR